MDARALAALAWLRAQARQRELLPQAPYQIERLAKTLGFPTSFFVQAERRIGLPHFHSRQRAKVPAKSLARIEAMINIRRQHVSKLIRSVETAVAKPIPQIDLDEQGLTPKSRLSPPGVLAAATRAGAKRHRDNRASWRHRHPKSLRNEFAGWLEHSFGRASAAVFHKSRCPG